MGLDDVGGRIRDRMREREGRPGRLTGRLLFGIIVLVLGVSWTLENLGLADVSQVMRFWPVLLLAYGVVRFTGFDGARRPTTGILFMLAGSWLLLRELGIVQISLFKLWPVFLIVLGGSLVWRSLRGPGSEDDPATRSQYPRPFAFMGANTTNLDSQELRGFDATAIMAGVELDLNHAKAAGPEVIAEVFAMWGGIEICVPEDWQVVCEATPIMGGVENETRFLSEGEPRTTLIVRGLVLMGGVEIKNGPADGRFTGVRAGVISGGSRSSSSRASQERGDG